MINQIHQDYINYKDIVKEHGYILNKQIKSNLLFIKLKNGQVKHEIKYFNNYKQIRTAYKHRDLDTIKNYMIEKGFKIGDVLSIDKICATAEFTNINDWLELAVALEDVKGITDKPNLESYEMALEHIVVVARSAAKRGVQKLLKRDIFDELDLYAAINEALEKNNYREHAVPITMIIKRIFTMIKDGATDAEIIEMIKKNLIVVNILEKQAEYLDITLGLRTTMPKGWKFGDDPLARINLLKEAA